MSEAPEASKELVLRVAAAQATLDEFKDRPFKLGSRDCVRMVAAHLRRLGVQVRLPPEGSYRSRRKALLSLSERGFASLSEALDGHRLERIPPASVLPGDILQLPAEDELGALVVALTNGRVIGYHQLAKGAAVMQPSAFVAAWRSI